ncbi:tRNA (adenosine(37)-N6)-threonylcarbamoyltransferase complex dimerization subunit type 1 TsaB [Cyanobium sp. ATX-6F1]|uniref:tRNA (adenosine(37)-N6)-threonylcarbamoyltransferase complex dimerization subunit type 1 TsaB n=1 Tax=Cyanobium sp. ATX-6F1 TaxID=3137388 RepID=UPI0039BE9FDC
MALHSSSDTLAVGLQEWPTVTLAVAPPVVAEFPLGRTLSTELFACVEQVLPASRWREISRLAVAIGPGGFTGTRLTVVMARTLAQQLAIPLDGVGSFLLIARRLRAQGVPGAAAERFVLVQTLPRHGLVAGCYGAGPAYPGGWWNSRPRAFSPLSRTSPQDRGWRRGWKRRPTRCSCWRSPPRRRGPSGRPPGRPFCPSIPQVPWSRALDGLPQARDPSLQAPGAAADGGQALAAGPGGRGPALDVPGDLAAPSPSPQMILVLGGDVAREQEAGRLARRYGLPVVVSGGSNPEYAQWLFANEGLRRSQFQLDYRARDTLTNFTSLVDELRRARVRHLLLVTSSDHMPRALLIGRIVAGSRGIQITPVPVPCANLCHPEGRRKVWGDGFRALVWVLTGRDVRTWGARPLGALLQSAGPGPAGH